MLEPLILVDKRAGLIFLPNTYHKWRLHETIWRIENIISFNIGFECLRTFLWQEFWIFSIFSILRLPIVADVKYVRLASNIIILIYKSVYLTALISLF